MGHKTIILSAAILMAAAPAAFAQQLQGGGGAATDSTSVRQFDHATGKQGTPAGTMGRSSSMPLSGTPASNGTYGGTQEPGHGGGDMGK